MRSVLYPVIDQLNTVNDTVNYEYNMVIDEYDVRHTLSWFQTNRFTLFNDNMKGNLILKMMVIFFNLGGLNSFLFQLKKILIFSYLAPYCSVIGH